MKQGYSIDKPRAPSTHAVSLGLVDILVLIETTKPLVENDKSLKRLYEVTRNMLQDIGSNNQ